MQSKRPVNLNLLNISFPITAIASISHRVSGVVLFLAIPAMLYLLEKSLHSPDQFAWVQTFMHQTWIRFGLWAVLCGLTYHLLAGVRHIIMDMGIGETKVAGTYSAVVLILLSALAFVGLGISLW